MTANVNANRHLQGAELPSGYGMNVDALMNIILDTDPPAPGLITIDETSCISVTVTVDDLDDLDEPQTLELDPSDLDAFMNCLGAARHRLHSVGIPTTPDTNAEEEGTK